MSTIESNPLQAGEEWLRARCGKLTASQAYPVLVMGARGKPLKAREDLKAKILAERLTGSVEPCFVSAAMQWGTDHEAEARRAYLAARGEPWYEPVGLVDHPSIPMLGASPDGLIDEEGLVEIKCPATVTHLRRIAEGKVPDEYRPQMLVQLACTGRRWVDYVDYDPRLQHLCPDAVLWITRFEPSREEIRECERLCAEFLDEVAAEEAAFRKILEELKNGVH